MNQKLSVMDDSRTYVLSAWYSAPDQKTFLVSNMDVLYVVTISPQSIRQKWIDLLHALGVPTNRLEQ